MQAETLILFNKNIILHSLAMSKIKTNFLSLVFRYLELKKQVKGTMTIKLLMVSFLFLVLFPLHGIENIRGRKVMLCVPIVYA
jgi:hypothetical protein